MKPITLEEMLALPLNKFVDRCVDWCEEFNDEQTMKTDKETPCSVLFWVVNNQKKCSKGNVANIEHCPVCDQPVCPNCMNHNVHQLLRVTGYLSTVAGWLERVKKAGIEG
ncbi:hypothetical protein [Methanolobus sp. ZRKC5]|uniref:hypothetical protein n=1 Tax=unclassified Methanolobus TaxID=2629569 RepID=UPI00313D4FCF